MQQRQSEVHQRQVQPHDMADDGGRIAKSAIQVTFSHPPTLPIFIPFNKLTAPPRLMRMQSSTWSVKSTPVRIG